MEVNGRTVELSACSLTLQLLQTLYLGKFFIINLRSNVCANQHTCIFNKPEREFRYNLYFFPSQFSQFKFQFPTRFVYF